MYTAYFDDIYIYFFISYIAEEGKWEMSNQT